MLSLKTPSNPFHCTQIVLRQTCTYFLHVQMHKTVLWDSIQSGACHCIWWICRSWETENQDYKEIR